jgi:hypothetical protein
MPPERDPRLWTRMVRIMFFTPGFLALLLIKAGEPAAFGITIELLLLACATSVVAGLFIASQSDCAGADSASRTSLWSGGLILEFLSVVPFICALPPLFHQLANSTLLHSAAPGAVDLSLGLSELIPAFALLPFLLYQLAGFGTLGFLVSRAANWAINLIIVAIMGVIYVSNRTANYGIEELFCGVLVVLVTGIVFYGVLKLRDIQAIYDAQAPAKETKKAKGDDGGKAVDQA